MGFTKIVKVIADLDSSKASSPDCIPVVKLKNCDCVGNRAKRRISKRVFQENKARQIFRKTNISYPLRMQTFQKSGKQDFSRRILEKSANMDESLESSVIRQKDKSQNGCFKKTKHAKFSEKQTFLTL